MGLCSPAETQCPGHRKGAWTADEDALLRKCMEKYGAVKWCLIPQRAGLNRCRKSCRLRWLNYLRPSIKRGKFGDDEVDLIIRLHKLLGNRWSLIAGRLPGRTANDIKNYWNTHLHKKLDVKDENEHSARSVKVLKPLPRTIPWNWSWLKNEATTRGRDHKKEPDIPKQPSSSHNNAPCIDNIISGEDVTFVMSTNEAEMTQKMQTKYVFGDIGSIKDDDFFLEGFGGWEKLQLDIDLWEDLRSV